MHPDCSSEGLAVVERLLVRSLTAGAAKARRELRVRLSTEAQRSVILSAYANRRVHSREPCNPDGTSD